MMMRRPPNMLRHYEKARAQGGHHKVQTHGEISAKTRRGARAHKKCFQQWVGAPVCSCGSPVGTYLQ